MNKTIEKLKILIVCEHSSDTFGGEAVLPLHYFKRLNARSEDAWLITHVRTKASLEKSIPDLINRIYFIPDTWLHVTLHKLGKLLPHRIALISTSAISHMITQGYQFFLARKAIKEHDIDVVHEPAPVSPKQPSILFGLGVPVIIGPMNGGVNFPNSFSFMQGKVEKYLYIVVRALSNLLNVVIPGKFFAKVLLVANERTRRALPRFTKGKIIEFVENGVDLSLWKPAMINKKLEKSQFTLIFLGRLIDLKCVDLLIKAFSQLNEEYDAKLLIVGEGKERNSLEILSRELGIEQKVEFLGWVSQQDCPKLLYKSDVLVLPSVRECGGAVVLEAMAAELPVIAVNWGGPADYITPETGILIEPEQKDVFIDKLSEAMQLLFNDKDKRLLMGKAGRLRVEEEFDWDKKIDNIMKIYRDVL